MDLSLVSDYQTLGDKSLPQFASVVYGATKKVGEGQSFIKSSPVESSEMATFYSATSSQFDHALSRLDKAFVDWRKVPAPKRGELVYEIGQQVRQHKEELALYIVYEAGKTIQEAQGEVQEWIDICDFAHGLSRQLYGLTIATERADHRLMEQWLPLGIIGVISAFNFPMAVWAWNAMLALVCGNTVVWKPSEKTPLCALACQKMVENAKASLGIEMPLTSVVIGKADIGEALSAHPKIPLVSATGSIPMGKKVAQVVGARLGRSLLELGGNNAMIVSKTADIPLTVRAAVFSAVGTTGQRCTTLRRLIVHKDIYEDLVPQLVKAYGQLSIGSPDKEGVLLGPLIDKQAYEQMSDAIVEAKQQGGKLLCGGQRVVSNVPSGGYYVEPAIIEISADAAILQNEVFAPILYVMRFDTIEQAIEINNGVPQGLSSSMMTESLKEAELFMSAAGSDCGIANINIGPSGAEIGGAFGGEKETGGGRESGSDAWKNYMRRATNTINYGKDLPLAQGIKFDI